MAAECTVQRGRLHVLSAIMTRRSHVERLTRRSMQMVSLLLRDEDSIFEPEFSRLVLIQQRILAAKQDGRRSARRPLASSPMTHVWL